jgi:hypothetical protein
MLSPKCHGCVIASQPVRPEVAGPMINREAIQFTLGKAGLHRRFAPRNNA